MVDITIEHQIVSGHNFDFAIYKNIQNIAVKLRGENDEALMINCHFDSVVGSSGASNGAMCCVMIEIFKVLSKRKEKLKNTIIFLFNGAQEERQASHGFITQHDWADDIKASINLENSGGGKEMLFRTSLKQDWLVRLYRHAAPHPFGQVLAEEVFTTFLSASRKDFHIADDGDITGLDFSYIEGGWRLRTQYDNINYVKPEAIQHTGENLLELTKKIANSNELQHPSEGYDVVYFDYLGLFFVCYSKNVGIALNITISILAFFIPFIIQTQLKLVNLPRVITETLISFATIVISTCLSAGACYIMAVIMNTADNTMSWFSTTFISIGLYGSLAVITQVAVYHIIQLLTRMLVDTKQRRQEIVKPSILLRGRLRIHLNGVDLFWASVTLVVTFLGYRFGYIPMIILLISLCTNIFTYTLCKFSPKTSRF